MGCTYKPGAKKKGNRQCASQGFLVPAFCVWCESETCDQIRKLISSAACLTPLDELRTVLPNPQILHDRSKKALMAPYTPTQPHQQLVDMGHLKSGRRGVVRHRDIVPTTHGAATAVAQKYYQRLKGRLDGYGLH